MKIITLGKCCRVSQQLRQLDLNGKDSMFEWMKADKFKDILKIISMAINGNEINITTRQELPENAFIHDTSIRTTHYKMDELPEIFKRRSLRFISDIQGNEPILFIRDDDDDDLCESDLVEFKGMVESINSKCIYRILLMSPHYKYHEIKMDKVIHVMHKENISEYQQLIANATEELLT
jgi:hypothetical protein